MYVCRIMFGIQLRGIPRGGGGRQKKNVLFFFEKTLLNFSRKRNNEIEN